MPWSKVLPGLMVMSGALANYDHPEKDMFDLDLDVSDAKNFRVRRDAPPSYGPPAPAYAPAPAYHGPPGRVGPVYTFVKTDPQANFKWGVRHRAGAQYGKRSAQEEDPRGTVPSDALLHCIGVRLNGFCQRYPTCCE